MDLKPYPRIPHLAVGPGMSADDIVLAEDERARLLSSPARVEEKLDGANVMLWLAEGGYVDAATRGGPGAMDRAGQLGPLRAWASERSDALRDVLDGGRVLYGEWLWFEHGVSYDRLPDFFVGIDVRGSSGRLLTVDERDALLERAGVQLPPVHAEGVFTSVEAVDALMSTSAFSSKSAAEGVILRALSGRLVAKRVSERFAQRTDLAWMRSKHRNRLSSGRRTA